MKRMILTLALIMTAVLTRAASMDNEYAYAIDLAPVEVTAAALDQPMMVLNLEAVVVTAPAIDVLYAEMVSADSAAVEMY